MVKFFMTDKYGKSDREMWLSQRATQQPQKEDWYARNMRAKQIAFSKERVRMQPHAGLEQWNNIHSRICDLAKFSGLEKHDAVVEHLEGILALVFAISGSQDFVSLSASVFLYVRKFFSASATKTIMDYVSEVFGMTSQGGEEDPVVGSSDWLEMMRNARDNWTLVRNNKLFAHFSKLLGLIVTLQLCQASQLTFVLKDFKVWEPDLKVMHGDALDIFDAALTTVTFFVEVIALCWRQKSLRPLLVNDQMATEMDEEYATVTMWWDLVKNGNLEKVAGVSEKTFDRRLEALATKLRNAIGSISGFEKKILNDKFARLLKIKNDYVTLKISSGVRKAPFCIELFGESSQGKTTFGEQIVHALLVSANLPTGKEYQASFNASDKYMSNWTTSKCVLCIDDMANDQSNFVERPPTRTIIDVCNNQPYVANMADIESKGKVFVEPEIVLVTTNVKDLDARVYSKCPYSIQRRMHAVITVRAKDEFQDKVDGETQGISRRKIAEYARNNPDAVFDDIWTLTIERAVKPPKMHQAARYAPIEYRGKEMKDISFREVVQYLITEFKEHRESQGNILDRMKKRKCVSVCGIDGCCQIKGWCDKHVVPTSLTPHFGREIVRGFREAGGLVTKRVVNDFFGFGDCVEGTCVAASLAVAKHFAKHWDWMYVVPSSWIEEKMFVNGLMAFSRDKLKKMYIRRSVCLWGTASLACFQAATKTRGVARISLMSSLVCGGLILQRSMVSAVKREFRNTLISRNTITPSLQGWRDEHVGKICKACAIVGALYGMAKVYRAWRESLPQGSLEPKTAAEVEQRDSEPNVWTQVSARPLPVVPDTANATSEQLQGLIEKNLVYGSVHISDKRTLRVNALFLTSNVVLMPKHYFEIESLNITFRKKDPQKSGGKFVTRLSLSQSVQVAPDLMICYSATGGSFKNLIKYFPEEKLPDFEFGLKWRDMQGEITNASGLATSSKCTTCVTFDGLMYKSLTINTFRGLCGAVIFAKRRPLICGFHLGGREDTPIGCAGTVFRNTLEKGIEDLRKCPGVIVSGSAEQFEPQVLGVTVLRDGELHHKSPLRYMPEDSQVEYYGQCPGMSTFKTNVKVTKISEHVMDVMGQPNVYCGPIVEPQYLGWQSCLANLARPALPYEPDLLIKASEDYKRELLPIFRSSLWKTTRKLTYHENLCGVPGKKFLDAIALSTSIGFPLSGPKREYVVELPPTEDKPCNRVFVPEIMEEIERCHSCYKRGERAYTIAKACKKDEVLSKPKSRIFYGNPIALTFLVRMYFLPLLRVLQFNPKVSECAVGVNCHSQEWQQLHEHVTKHGDDRLIGGDYAKYDQKLPSQVLFAALRVLIDFARECDYSETDLKIMEAMTGDLVFAVIAYNGDLIGTTEGTHISGNSLTSVLNGICGSLNLRCFFLKNNPHLKFREHVALITYGDDNLGSVSKTVNNFTIKGISLFLKKYGQEYTMPDKTSELAEFLPYEDFEFLKRFSNYIPELGQHVGALVNKSCYKMLHCYLRDKNSPLTEDHACAINIDTALREWFNHGRDVYENRRQGLTEVAKRADVTHLCTQLNVSFDDAVAVWHSKYGPNS